MNDDKTIDDLLHQTFHESPQFQFHDDERLFAKIQTQLEPRRPVFGKGMWIYSGLVSAICLLLMLNQAIPFSLAMLALAGNWGAIFAIKWLVRSVTPI